MTAALPVVDLGGGPGEIGLGHGRALRERIERCLAIYAVALQRPESALRAAAAAIEARIRRFAPGLAEEMAGIAEGAGVDRFWIQVLNARSELLAGRAGGCTAVFLPRLGLLGQTWDWLALLEPLVAVLRITAPGGVRLLTLTEPGMVGKIGCNSAGLGVCLNFLFAPPPLDGLPVHVLLRELLQQPSLGRVRARLDDAGVGRAANVLVGSARGGGIDVACVGDTRVVAELARDPFVHTNHVGEDRSTGGPLYDNSVARLGRARGLAGGVATAADLLALLADRSDPQHPICASYRPFATMPEVVAGTVATVVMELPAGRLHLRLGPDPAAAVTTLAVG